MQLINNFDDYLEKIYSELDNINQSYYNTFLTTYFQTLNTKWKDYEIDQDDYSEEVTDCLEEGLETINFIIQELENEDQSYLDLETMKLIKELFINLCKELNVNLDNLQEEILPVDNEINDTLNNNIDENKNINDTPTEYHTDEQHSSNKQPVNEINDEFDQMDKEIKTMPQQHVNELNTPPRTISDFDILENHQKIQEIFNRASENYMTILDKIENLNLIVSPEAIKELTTKFELLDNNLQEQYNKLDTNLKEFIENQVVEIKEKTELQLKEAIDNKKIQTELDKKSKGFLAIGGISSVLFSLFVIVQVFLGITYYQGYIKYQNLMEVFDNMPTNQRQQLSEWISTSYQNLNTKDKK